MCSEEHSMIVATRDMTALSDSKYCVHKCRSRHQNIPVASISDKYDKQRLATFNVKRSVNRMRSVRCMSAAREKKGERWREWKSRATMTRIFPPLTQQRVNPVSGGLAPEFETFPVTSTAEPRARCAPAGAMRGATGRRTGTKVSVCIKPPEATDCRF